VAVAAEEGGGGGGEGRAAPHDPPALPAPQPHPAQAPLQPTSRPAVPRLELAGLRPAGSAAGAAAASGCPPLLAYAMAVQWSRAA